MEKQNDLLSRKVLIVGLARSGLACARLLLKRGARVSVSESSNDERLAVLAQELARQGAKVELGGHSEGFIKQAELIVISPGVTPESLPCKWAAEAGIKVISEVEAAWQLCPATVIATTGTNGKTTVTELIGRLLNACGKTAHVCGNIGNPFSGEIEKIKEGDFVSLEISSFQLEAISTFKPRIALILNFTPDHLNRYSSMEEYLRAKKRLFMNQDENDYLLLGAGPELKRVASEARSKVIFFEEKNEGGLNPNQLAVMAVADILRLDKDAAGRVLSEFKGLEHRMEYCARIDGIDFINDSKSTNVEATQWALKILKQPLVLIAGGSDKGLDYTAVGPHMRGKVKNLILIGQTRKKIASDIGQAVENVEEACDMAEAVKKAYQRARKGDCVILSPMCASFDMFRDYEHRGRVFKDEVEKLKTARSKN